MVLLVFNGLQAQFISNIGLGFGAMGGTPSSLTVEGVEDCFVSNSFLCFNSSNPSGTIVPDVSRTQDFANRSFNIQFANLSYEPRFYILDSVINSASLSLGMPLNFSFALHSRDGRGPLEDYEEFDMTFQGALIAYLNFGKEASYQDLYSSRYGFSLGGGVMYSYIGVFKNELNDLDPPPNNLIQPVLSINFRYLSPTFVLSEFNLLIRPTKQYIFSNRTVDDCCERINRTTSVKEFGFLLQYRVFFENY